MNKEDSTLDAFGSIVGELFGNVGGGSDFPVMSPPVDDDDVVDGEDNKDLKDIDDIVEPPVDVDKDINKDTDLDIDDKDDDDVKNIDIEPIKSMSELGEAEPEIAAFVQEKLYEKLGWEIDEEGKFEKIEDLVDYLEKVVETNSKPDFASSELEELNKFVKEGGKIRDYFDNVYGEFDLEKLDLERESNQVRVLQESLKLQGYSNDKIEKRIKRYEDTGTLEDEALDAAEFLKVNKEKTKEKLLAEQTKIQQDIREQQQKFYDDVSSNIKSLEDIKGIKLSKADREKLVDYIFKPGSDGKTQYQRDYAKSNKNLIESAFFTMKGDSLVKGITRQAESQATKNLRQKLALNTKKGKETGAYDDDGGSGQGSRSTLDIFGSFIKP